MVRKKEAPYFNRSLERALQILNAFETGRNELTMTQLSESLGLPTATVLRLCSTLVKYGFLNHDPYSKRYSLGFRIFELGKAVPSTGRNGGHYGLDRRGGTPEIRDGAAMRAGIRHVIVMVMSNTSPGREIREYVIPDPEKVFEEIAAFMEERSVPPPSPGKKRISGKVMAEKPCETGE